MVKAWLGNCLLRCMEGFCDVNWFSSVIEGKKSASSVNTSLERHILNCWLAVECALLGFCHRGWFTDIDTSVATHSLANHVSPRRKAIFAHQFFECIVFTLPVPIEQPRARCQSNPCVERKNGLLRQKPTDNYGSTRKMQQNGWPFAIDSLCRWSQRNSRYELCNLSLVGSKDIEQERCTSFFPMVRWVQVRLRTVRSRIERMFLHLLRHRTRSSSGKILCNALIWRSSIPGVQ